jgi:hypothetical protein
MRRPSAVVRLLAVPLVVPLLGLAACSGEAPAADPGPSADPARSAARESLVQVFAGDQPTEQGLAEGECFADELLADVTPGDLQEYGVLDQDYAVVAGRGSLPPGLAKPWAESQLHCVSFLEASTRAQRAATKGRLDAPAYRSCLADAVDEAQALEGTTAALQGEWGDPALARLGSAQSACAGRATPAD